MVMDMISVVFLIVIIYFIIQLKKKNTELKHLEKSLRDAQVIANHMAEYQEKNEKLLKEIKSKEKEAADIKIKLADVYNEVRTAKDDNSNLKKEISKIKNEYADLKEKYVALDIKNKEDQEKIIALKKESNKPKKALEEVPQTLEEKISIKEFCIEPCTEATFSNEFTQVKAKLNSISDISSLMKVISDSDYEHKDIYEKKVKQYQKDFQQKLLDKIDDFEDDEEELSYNVTSKFIKIMKLTLMKLLRSIRFANPHDVEFNRSFLKELKLYMAKCGFSTIDIMPNTICDDNAIEVMQILFQDTDDADKDRLITDVEQLPYVMYYYDDDGNKTAAILDGTMAVLRYKK
jgi:DNA repair exonuclease SbcCD ATPase subunit